MVTSIAISILGLVFGRRIFVHFDQNQIFNTTASQKLWIIFISLHVLMFFLFQESLLTLWSCEVAMMFLPLLVYVYQDWTRKMLFRSHVVPMLDILVLQMRSGRTLRESLGQCSANLVSIQLFIKELNSLLQFETGSAVASRDLFFSRVANELLEIHRTPIKSIERLRALRSRLKTEQDFRQRSKQMTTQVRLQAAVLLMLYLGLLSYLVWSYPWAQIERSIFASSFLFLAGLAVLLTIPRSFRWKI